MPANDALWAYAHKRAQSHQAILGGRLPTNRDLFLGAPFLRGSIELDFQAWSDSIEPPVPGVVAAMARARTHFDARSLHELLVEIEGRCDPAWSQRVLVYLACSGSDEARRRLAHVIVATASISAARVYWQATVWGLLRGQQSSMEAYYRDGMQQLHAVSIEVQELVDGPPANDHLVDEDRAEIAPGQADDDGEETAGDQLMAALGSRRAPGLVVVPKLVESTGAKREIAKTFTAIAGKRLPLTPLRDLAGVRSRLQERWPHATVVIDALMFDIATRQHVQIRPTVLVGSPGSGKSALAEALCRELGLPWHVIGLGGASDSSLGGTSAQWHSARPSVVLQHILQDKSATIGIVWDEVDKASPDRRNGSAFDSLLPLLEGDQAKRFRDPALEVEVNLSAVTHIATANVLSDVPAPLRDRMRILQVPTPTWQQVGPLVAGIVAEIMAERGMAEWSLPLAQDEMAVLEAAWGLQPSFRALRRVLGDMLTARESLWGRA